MTRDRSSDISAAYRMLMKEDTPGDKLVRVWIWEYVLKFTSDAKLIRELTDALAFPQDAPRLKQIVLLNELSSQVAKGLVGNETVETLEALLYAVTNHTGSNLSTDLEGGVSRAHTGERSKKLKVCSVERISDSQDELLWDRLKESIKNLKAEMQQLLDCSAAENDLALKDRMKEAEAEKKLSSLIQSVWDALGPCFLEKTEQAVLKGLYKPSGMKNWLPAELVTSLNVGSKEVHKEVGCGKSIELEGARQELVDSCAELQKVVQDPLPGLLRKGGVAESPACCPDKAKPNTEPGIKRSLLDPHPSAQAQCWDDDEDDKIEDSSQPDDSPSASGRVRLPPIRNSKKRETQVLSGSPPTNRPRSSMSGGNRRKVRKWSEVEVETLKREVAKVGKGRWKWILTRNAEVFSGRTEVDIKDKWRNLEKYEGIRLEEDW